MPGVQVCSSHDTLIPLFKLCALLNAVALFIGIFGLLFALLQNIIATINVENPIIAEKLYNFLIVTFFDYLRYKTTNGLGPYTY